MPSPAYRFGVLLPFAMAAIVVAGCGAGRSATPEPLATPVPATAAPVTGEVPPAVVDAARADLAASVGAEAAAVATIVKAEAVEWPDGSLGCPQPDMLYPQVITPGYQIVFEVDGKQYDYRATVKGGVMLCESAPPGG
jgi:hypothetical protein